jgi:Arc/MetJ family transcription regulator
MTVTARCSAWPSKATIVIGDRIEPPLASDRAELMWCMPLSQGRMRCGRARIWRRLPYCHIDDTDFHMKTTLNIDDTVMAELKREAARQGRTMSEMVETALRLLLRSQRKRETIPALPTFRSGGALVDIADRDALYQAMEGR